jgi:hypothetical protein
MRLNLTLANWSESTYHAAYLGCRRRVGWKEETVRCQLGVKIHPANSGLHSDIHVALVKVPYLGHAAKIHAYPTAGRGERAGQARTTRVWRDWYVSFAADFQYLADMFRARGVHDQGGLV